MYEIIQHQRLSADSANITFTNIPQSYTDLYLSLSLRGESERMFFIGFNDFSITPTVRYLYGIGSGSGASEAPGLPTAGFGSLSTDTASTFGAINIHIPNYTSSSSKTYSSDSAGESNATFSIQAITAGFWNSTSPINTLRITCRTGNTLAGSSATLYGVTRKTAIGRPKAFGGNITFANGYWVHTFTGSGSFYALEDLTVDALVIGGGGAGGFGGGGAGGYREAYALQVSKNTSTPAIVGAGGPSAPWTVKSVNGANSTFLSVTSAGGGAGGVLSDTASVRNGNAGGSGGGGGGGDTANGEGSGGAGNTPSTSPSQGNSGGTGHHYPGIYIRSGGGGGAGGSGSSNPYPNQGSTAGGAGVSSSFSGSAVTYAKGGNGGNDIAPATTPANTGNGGNGTSFFSGAWQASDAGGSGVVIVRYRA